MIVTHEHNERDYLALSDGLHSEEFCTNYNPWPRRWDVRSHMETLLRHHRDKRADNKLSHAKRVGERFARQLKRNGQLDMLEPQYALWIMGQFKLAGVSPMCYEYALDCAIQEANRVRP